MIPTGSIRSGEKEVAEILEEVSGMLSVESIELDSKVGGKEEALSRVVELLPLDTNARDIVLSMLQQREELGSTGLGKGVAIPHGRSVLLKRLMISFLRPAEPIEYNAVDDKPVQLIFCIVAPPVERKNTYLPVLGFLARILKRKENRERLLKAKDPEKVLEVLNRLANK
jgi:mannitol/fructose-specific phosphotransferase system IIA component (Ntr-type)